jgi:hypothetical protein
MHYKQYTEGPYTTPETSKRDDNLEVAQFGPALIQNFVPAMYEDIRSDDHQIE